MSNLLSAKKVLSSAQKLKSASLMVTIKIDGKSARDLLAVGPIDIRDYFLNAGLKVDPRDVKSVRFTTSVPRNYTRRVNKGVHKDNFGA